ncbi:hypothetical protein F5Y07DRAFT_350755 [Xylaria sp. FL0933]|nr:hypothetical protein F5Y07DRAFT_350755 [Xylaria sp. FL0933]
MEPPTKRLRLGPSPHGAEDDDDEDELSMTPAQFDTTQDPMYQLDKGRARAATRLKSTFEDIFEKYGRDFDGDDDVINFYTDEIEVDNGHVQSLENRKDGATDDSLSGDEEDRILNGKSGGHRKKTQSKSLIPGNHAGYSQRLHFNSSWNATPGLGTPRLSSLAFSSPYGTPPPFEFRFSTLGNDHVDPVWQAPDLPVRPTHYQYGPLLGMSGSQYGSFGGLPDSTERRLVKARSFLRIASTTTSKIDSGDTEQEEDDILLGRNSQAKGPLPHLKDHEKVHVSTTSSSCQPSQGSDHQPPFSGLGLIEDEPDAVFNDIQKEEAEFPIAESEIGVGLAPRKSTEGDEDDQHHQAARSADRLSPSRQKRGRRKKSDTRKPSNVPRKEPSNGTRILQPNERRIEIIIPTRKEMSPTKMAEPLQETVFDETLQPSDMEYNDDEDIEVAPPEDISHTSRSLDTHENPVQQPLAGVASATKHALSLPRPDGSQLKQSGKTKKHAGFFSMDSSPDYEEILEYTCIETGQEGESSRPEPELDIFSDDIIADKSLEIGQNSIGDNENGTVSSSQAPSLISNAGINEEQLAHSTNLERGVKARQPATRSPKVISVQSASLTEVLGGSAANDPAEVPDLSINETIVLGRGKPQEPQNLPSEIEDYSRNDPRSSPQSFSGDELPPMPSDAPDSAIALFHNIRQKDVLQDSEVVDSCENGIPALHWNVGSRSPDHSVILQSTESDPFEGRDSLPPSFEASEICDDQEPSTPNQLFCSNVLVAEVDGLQLGPDRQDAQSSPSIEVAELPDQDLSVFPGVSNSPSTSEPLLPLLSRPTESNDQNSTALGRSPSPELGTPVRSKATSRNASRTKVSPVPATPTRRQGSRSTNSRSSRHRTPSRKRFPLTSLISEGTDEESDDELSIAGSVSSMGSRLFSPFFRATHNENSDLPPLLSTPRNNTRKHSYLAGSPPSSTRKPDQVGFSYSRKVPPATESRKGRSQTRRGPDRAVHSSPLARRVAERLLSSPTKKHHATTARRPSMVPSPNGTLRRCGQDGFECGRDFCLTCCV